MLSHYDAENYTAQKIGSKPSRWAVAWTAFFTFQRTSGGNTNVAYLNWNDDHVIVNWNWLENDWNGTNPTLLANLFISPMLWWGSFVFYCSLLVALAKWGIIRQMEDTNQITYFAETDSRGKRTRFGIKSQDRLKHVYVIGKTGMGKSTLLENMAIQDIQNGNGIAFLDPHGGTAERLLEYVPEERVKDVLYFAPFDLDYPVSFNIMEDIGVDKRHLVVNGLMSAFKKLFGEESFSDRMQYILQNTILALLEYPGATLLGINKMLVDKVYRNKVIANVTDPSVKTYWTKEYAGYTERFAAEAIPAIQNKIGQFTSNPLVRNIIGQEKSSFDLRKIMDGKKIFIANLSKGRVGEGNANLLGSMLITKIYLAAMSRAEKSGAALSKLPSFYLYVDEFQSFANESFADILSEARKYKLSLTLTHQYIEQMEEEVRDAVFGNVGTTITFRVGAFDADILEKEFAPVFLAEDLVNLGLRQIYLKLMIDGIGSQPFSANTIPPIEPPKVSYVEKIIESSRKTFAKPRSEVEKRIADWHEDSPAVAKTQAPKTPVSKPPVPIAIPRPVVAQPPPFRPPEKKSSPSISLTDLKDKNNNQRKPDPKRLSDLRDALKAVVGDAKVPAKPVNSHALPTSGGLPPSPKALADRPTPTPSASGPSAEELKKILDVQ